MSLIVLNYMSCLCIKRKNQWFSVTACKVAIFDWKSRWTSMKTGAVANTQWCSFLKIGFLFNFRNNLFLKTFLNEAVSTRLLSGNRFELPGRSVSSPSLVSRHEWKLRISPSRPSKRALSVGATWSSAVYGLVPIEHLREIGTVAEGVLSPWQC